MYQVIKTSKKLGHYRNGFCVLLLLIFYSLNAIGQDFNTHWIYAPQSDSTSHVYFRRAFISNGRPRQAEITVTSTGYYKLYVNECNVGTALFYPYRENKDTAAIATTFDISPYLRPDTNVVALLYSAPFPSQTQKQIAVNVYGKSKTGSTFSYSSDGSWLCRRANSSMTTDGGELIDGREHDPSWKAATIYNQAMWLQAKEAKNSANSILSNNLSNGYFASNITTYISDDITTTQDDLNAIEPAYGFCGFPRATIREARRGEGITIGNLHYVCNGEIDEQAFPQFSIEYQRTIPISGDNHFKPSQIMFLETVNVTTH